MFKYSVTPKLLSIIKQVYLTADRIERSKLSQVVLFELEDIALEQSSYSSTSIEGNPLPLTEVRKILKKRPNVIRDTEREVIQYNDTLIWLNEQIAQNSKLKFNEALIFKIHTSLMQKLLPKIKMGSFRKEPVLVNDPKLRNPIFWPPDHKDVNKLISELIVFLQTEKLNLDPLILAGIFHKQFVLIHPFIDGNGRTVRLATKTLLAELGLNTFRLFSFETFYNKNVSKYFQYVGERGDFYDLHGNVNFTPWLEYFCEGVLDELLRVEKSMQQATAIDPKQKLNKDQEQIIHHITEHGFIKDSDYAMISSRSKAARTLDFKKLIQLHLIERQEKGPATFYKLKK